MKEELILLARKNPNIYEIHKGSINQVKNIIFTTYDEQLAKDIVNSYNKFIKEGINTEIKKVTLKCLKQNKNDNKKESK
jgi:hypothetical protein